MIFLLCGCSFNVRLLVSAQVDDQIKQADQRLNGKSTAESSRPQRFKPAHRRIKRVNTHFETSLRGKRPIGGIKERWTSHSVFFESITRFPIDVSYLRQRCVCLFFFFVSLSPFYVFL